MDYRNTLNLPATDFAMKADLPTREPAIQERWNELGIYQQSLSKPAPKGRFLLHDGPPYSNGNIHLGHALNKTLKDIVVKYKTMAGYEAPYVPGWDNHGLPIEVAVVKELREEKVQWTPDTLRARCREYATRWVTTQKTQFQRLGIRGDWDHPYLTMAPAFESKIVETFLGLCKQGYVYRGLKPVLWDPANETALANTEAEHKDHISPSIHVAFPLLAGGDPNGVLNATPGVRVLIWTTTPWTIPANTGLSVHPDFDYVVVGTSNHGPLLVADGLLTDVTSSCALENVTELLRLRGAELVGLRFQHPLHALDPVFDRESPICPANYVTLDTGTGIVHTAPGHGPDDYITGMKHGLRVLSPVDGRGRFTEDAGPFVGISTDEGNKVIPQALTDAGALLALRDFSHKYPHAPRAPYKPLIFRATVQWFVAVDHNDLRKKALAGIDTVAWYPPQASNRISAAVAGRPDWTVSRQRHWGVPIAIFYANGEPVFDENAYDAAVAVIKENGIEAWYSMSPVDILPDGFTYKGIPASEFTKEKDVLDVWFDSGSTSFAVLDSGVWPDHSWPADLYLEGSDQHRGWFNSSLMIATAMRGVPPYRAVVTNGFTVDELGYKMSKSKGNTIDPLGTIDRYGADVLRLWVGSIEYTEDTRLGDGILKQLADSYRKLRNTVRFLLGNLAGYNPATDAVAVAELHPLDAYALSRLQSLITDVTAAYDEYAFYKATQAVLNYCNVELSAFYLDVLKDRLYTELPDSPLRRSSQTVLWEICSALCRMMTPILSHTCEEIWQHLPGTADIAISPQLADFPVADPAKVNADVEALFGTILQVRDAFNASMETVRAEGGITKSAEAWATVTAPLDAAHIDVLREALIVAKLDLTTGSEISVSVQASPGQKCMRSWFIREDVGTDPEHPTLSIPQALIVRELIRRGAVALETEA
jgi:isoleucyl-tRNA synthetase